VQISNRIRRYLDLAKQKAWESDFHHKHGAVLVKGGSVLNTSFNNARYSSFAHRFRDHAHNATRHAEIMCVLGLSREMTEGTTLYVVRINNKGHFMLSKPCEMCSDLLVFCGVKKVIYSVNNEEIKSVKMK
jgi:tRNA(Arg) A34 adenosine deaminase TadA